MAASRSAPELTSRAYCRRDPRVLLYRQPSAKSYKGTTSDRTTLPEPDGRCAPSRRTTSQQIAALIVPKRTQCRVRWHPASPLAEVTVASRMTFDLNPDRPQ